MPFLGNITPKEVFEMGLHARPCHQRDSRRCNRNLLRAPEVDLVISYYCQQESQVPRPECPLRSTKGFEMSAFMCAGAASGTASQNQLLTLKEQKQVF